MEWSPQNAIEAYLQTLHLCKVKNIESVNNTRLQVNQKQVNIEPQGLELISALAAGNQAKSIIHVTKSKPNGLVTPLIHALAVAANQTGGKLTCIVAETNNYHLESSGDNVVEFKVGDPCEVVKGVGVVDFVVIECGFDMRRLGTFFESIRLNSKGAIVVADNVVHREQGVVFVDKVLGGIRGVESSITTIPLGSTRVQVIIRIKCKKAQGKRHKRFLVTFDG